MGLGGDCKAPISFKSVVNILKGRCDGFRILKTRIVEYVIFYVNNIALKHRKSDYAINLSLSNDMCGPLVLHHGNHCEWRIRY